MFSNGSLLHVRMSKKFFRQIESEHICQSSSLWISRKSVRIIIAMAEKYTEYYEEVGLTRDQVSELRKAFDSFDSDKRGAISAETTGTILRKGEYFARKWNKNQKIKVQVNQKCQIFIPANFCWNFLL